MVTIINHTDQKYTEILIVAPANRKFGRFELVFSSFDANSSVGSTLKSDTVLMNIITLKFAADLTSFKVTLGSAATHRLPEIIGLAGYELDSIEVEDHGLLGLYFDHTTREFTYSPAIDFFYEPRIFKSLPSIEITLLDKLLSKNIYEMNLIVLPSFASQLTTQGVPMDRVTHI